MVNPRELEAGPELDALVAERVMGWRKDGIWWRGGSGLATGWTWDGDRTLRPLWAPSQRTIDGGLVLLYSSMEAAWQVLERMHVRGHPDFGVLRIDEGLREEEWEAGASSPTAAIPWTEGGSAWCVRAPTPQLAICRAALCIVEATK